MRPNQPGYNLATADLQRARISQDDLARIVVHATGGNPNNAPGIASGAGPNPMMALLAQIALTQRTANARFGPFTFSLAAWFRVQVLQENPNRKYFILQNVGSGDLMIVFESANVSPQDMSAAAGQSELTVQQTRAIRIVAGGSYEPIVAPTNPISIFTLGTATNGIVIEGV